MFRVNTLVFPKGQVVGFDALRLWTARDADLVKAASAAKTALVEVDMFTERAEELRK